MGTAARRADQPDVIILDLGLPGGGGITFLRRAKSNAIERALGRQEASV